MILYEWGLTCYVQALEKMDWLRDKRINNQIEDSLIIVEHPPTITIGRNGGTFYVPMEELHQRGVGVYNVGRAGEATAHNPGQVVIYPIIHLKANHLSPRHLVEDLVLAISDTACQLGVPAIPDLEDRVGVWVNGRKLAAIGMQISQGVTSHGIAFNVNNDISLFNCIDACGQGRYATSMQLETGQPFNYGQVQKLCVQHIIRRLKARMRNQLYQEKIRYPLPEEQALAH